MMLCPKKTQLWNHSKKSDVKIIKYKEIISKNKAYETVLLGYITYIYSFYTELVQ